MLCVLNITLAAAKPDGDFEDDDTFSVTLYTIFCSIVSVKIANVASLLIPMIRNIYT